MPNHAALLLLTNWFYAYGVLSTRVAKTKLGKLYAVAFRPRSNIVQESTTMSARARTCKLLVKQPSSLERFSEAR